MQRKKAPLLTVREIVVFAMLGTLMFVSKIVMELLPNVHLLGTLTMVYTLVYRKKALIPIYVYVFVNGLFVGFDLWWRPYLYIWAILWAVTMLLPQNMPPRVAPCVYMGVSGLFGLLFGTLYAPYNSLVFGLSFEKTLTWIAFGFPYDALHMVGNLAAGVLIVPMQRLLLRLEKR